MGDVDKIFDSKKRAAYLKKLGAIKLEVDSIDLGVLGSELKPISTILMKNTLWLSFQLNWPS